MFATTLVVSLNTVAGPHSSSSNLGLQVQYSGQTKRIKGCGFHANRAWGQPQVRQ